MPPVDGDAEAGVPDDPNFQEGDSVFPAKVDNPRIGVTRHSRRAGVRSGGAIPQCRETFRAVTPAPYVDGAGADTHGRGHVDGTFAAFQTGDSISLDPVGSGGHSDAHSFGPPRLASVFANFSFSRLDRVNNLLRLHGSSTGSTPVSGMKMTLSTPS